MNKSRSAYLKVFPLLLSWFTVMFNIVNLIIQLPVFHLYKMKTIQEPPTYVEETQEVGIPIEQV